MNKILLLLSLSSVTGFAPGRTSRHATKLGSAPAVAKLKCRAGLQCEKRGDRDESRHLFRYVAEA